MTQLWHFSKHGRELTAEVHVGRVNLEQKTSRMICMEFDGWVMQKKKKHPGTQDDLAAIKRDMEVS